MTQAYHILLVDDDVQLLELVEDALMSFDLKLTAVSSTQEAISIAEATMPNLIFMDLLMPAPSLKGWEAIERLKKNPKTAEIPIFALTAASNDSIMKALQAGADDYITKPFTIARFQAFVMSRIGAVK